MSVIRIYSSLWILIADLWLLFCPFLSATTIKTLNADEWFESFELFKRIKIIFLNLWIWMSFLPSFFKCNKCDRVPQALDNLKSHLRQKRCTPKYECDQSGKQFLIQKHLMHRKLNQLKPIDKIFNCEKWHAPFESVEFLRENEKRTNPTYFECYEFDVKVVLILIATYTYKSML